MIGATPSLPKVHLDRLVWVRMVIVGILVVVSLARVVPDFVRIVYPLHVFGYNTDGDGRVTTVAVLRPPKPKVKRTPAPAKSSPAAKNAVPATKPETSARRTAQRQAGASPGSVKTVDADTSVGGKHAAGTPKPTPAPTMPGDRLKRGDLVRVDRIMPYDRKPGLTGRGYTYDNTDRYLPIVRDGTERVVHLVSRSESDTVRFFDMLRILLFVAAIALGSILFLVKPSIATAAFFVFCLAGVEAPATFLDTIVPNPWRPLPEWVTDTIRGAVRPALLLFALCLIDGDADAPRERVFAWFAGVLALSLGTLHAYAEWRLNYAALPAEQLRQIFAVCSYTVSAMTVVAFTIAFWRAPLNDRHRIGWIVVAFLFAGAARLVSDAYFPGHIPFWVNSILVSMTIIPIVTIWIAVVRHRFFNVDFVVSRAIVYVSVTAAVVGTIWIAEEVGTYVWIQNTDISSYAYIYAIATTIGMCTGKIRDLLTPIVDRFIFRDRRQQREALEFIAGYILDAETVDDVYRALLQDAAHALKLSFGGILARQPDGSYVLSENYNWPEDFVIKLGPSDELTRAITRTRGALTFSGKDSRLIQQSFPNERLTFVAPLFYDRIVSGIVMYGHNVSGLDLDPEEREHLIRVVAHASLALNAIELARYRGGSPADEHDPLPISTTSELQPDPAT